jgi:cardiolipin synthase C
VIALSLGACRSLPDVSGRAPSTAAGNERTKLAATVRPRVAAHPGLSGIHMLPNGHDAFAARLILTDAAQRSLDVQYFIWNQDLTGRFVVERLLRAADRGVRVRMLIDDLGTMVPGRTLLALDSHPNVEVRLFNPAALRSPRVLGVLLEIGRMNRRMHNKSFTADGSVTILGGRNIGDEYFAASQEREFSDLDVAMIGPAVKEVSAQFDLYWNSRASIGVSDLSRPRDAATDLAALRASLAGHDERVRNSPYAKSVRDSVLARDLKSRSVPWTWSRARVVYDHPDKALSADPRLSMAPELAAAAAAAKDELFIVSPYFIPGKKGLEFLVRARERGRRVVVVTNSLASTDGNSVHSKYKNYRKPLLRAGAELYELKPVSGTERLKLRWGRTGQGLASLHAKTFAFDRRTLFAGSYNLTPRSDKLNMEMGVFLDSPALASRLPAALEPILDTEAYRLAIERNRLVWITQEGGREVRYYHDPATSYWRRLKVGLMGLLPIENLL